MGINGVLNMEKNTSETKDKNNSLNMGLNRGFDLVSNEEKIRVKFRI